MENQEQFDIDLEELKAMLEDQPDLNIEAAPEPVPARNPEPAKPEEKQQKENWQKNLLMYLHDLIYLLGILLIVSLLLVRIVVVSGSSMNRTLLDGDYLFVLSNTFYHKPDNGDIVVVSKKIFDNGSPIVKRVIATEGQWVDIRNGIVYVGDTLQSMVPLAEGYTTTETAPGNGFQYPIQVEEGCIFCLGDNRIVSHDSRSSDIGMIDCNEVLGKVMFLFLPGTEKDGFGRPVEAPDYGRIGVVE